MKSWTRIARQALAAALVSFLASCATWYDVRYAPAPLEIKVADAATPELSGRLLVSVFGVRRPAEGRPAQFEFVLRLENLGHVPVGIDPASVELLTADLQSLGSGRFAPEPPAILAPGAAQNLELVFPLPEGRKFRDYDARGLNLRLALVFDGRRQVVGASFQRRFPTYYGYDYHDDLFYHGGWYGYCHGGVGRFGAY